MTDQMAADPHVTLNRWHNLLQTDGAWVPPAHAELWSALRAMDAGARDALLLATLDGRSVAEIAAILDESSGTVAFWISSGRRQLPGTTAEIRDSLLALADAAPATALAARPRPRRSAIIPALGAIAVVIVAAVVVMQLVKEPGAGVGSAPGGSGSVGATPSGPVVSALGWTSVEIEAGAFVSDLAAASNQLIAVGATGEGTAGAWVSADEGASWRRVKLPLTPPVKGAQARLGHVAADGTTIVATGEWTLPNQAASQPSWASWFRADARGPEWHEAPGLRSGVVFDLAATPRGFVAVGMDFGRGTVQAWHSTDGLQWSSLRTQGLPEFGAVGLNLALFKDRLIAAGENQGGSRPRIGIWSTTDGTAWTAAPDAPVAQGTINDMSAGADRVLAVGATWSNATNNEDSVAMLWSSTDGATWRPLVLNDRTGTQAGVVADGPLGAVIGGASQADGGPLSWFLPLGAAQAVPQVVDRFITAAIALPDRFVAVGTCAEGTECSGQTLLIGRPAGSASDPPVPSP